jgi:N-acetylmuramoyl-L-alanine amidase
MKKNVSHHFFWVAGLFLIFLCGQAGALEIRDVRIGVHSDKTRIVLELSGSPVLRTSMIKVRTQAAPDRIAVDLPQFDWQVKPVRAEQGSGVIGIRHGDAGQGNWRVIFDLQAPLNVTDYFILPAEQGKPVRLVIDVLPLSKSRSVIQSDARQPVASDIAKDPPAVSKQVKPDKKYIVVIDPGHGGQDPGAIGGNKVAEKTVVLALARELRDQLEKTGRFKVVLTRERDMFVKLSERVKFARNHKADLFVSLHADSINKPGVQGASIYTLSETASDEQTAKLAERENQADLIGGLDLSTEDEEVAGILIDLAMRETMNQSKFFAGKLVGSFAKHDVALLEEPHRHAGFAVLKAPDVPSVLIEAGFMSNKSEAKLLNTPAHRAKIAQAVTQGIMRYFDYLQVKQSGIE